MRNFLKGLFIIFVFFPILPILLILGAIGIIQSIGGEEDCLLSLFTDFLHSKIDLLFEEKKQ